jgi:hypothetical protein
MKVNNGKNHSVKTPFRLIVLKINHIDEMADRANIIHNYNTYHSHFIPGGVAKTFQIHRDKKKKSGANFTRLMLL